MKLTLILFACAISAAVYGQPDSCSFFGNKPIYPYYIPGGLSNGKDFYTVKKEFQKIIIAQTAFNGIITVNFFINYKGDADFYRTQVCDLNYTPYTINTELEPLCSQVLLAVKQAGPWKPAMDHQKNLINSRKFYSFRFNNGKLIEVLPK